MKFMSSHPYRDTAGTSAVPYGKLPPRRVSGSNRNVLAVFFVT